LTAAGDLALGWKYVWNLGIELIELIELIEPWWI
jgi:hypothetical protein